MKKLSTVRAAVLTLSNEKVEHGEGSCVAREHVVATGPNSLDAQPAALPDDPSLLHLHPHAAALLEEGSAICIIFSCLKPLCCFVPNT